MSLPLLDSCAARELLKEGAPMLDVRAELEFDHGHIPHAVNLPLLRNAERKEIGTTYKEQGSQAAIQRGHAIVAGDLREMRIEEWKQLIDAGQVRALYCARGGLRSEISQRWLAERGTEIPRIAGGYKVLRNQCLNILREEPSEHKFIILSGRTGSGKTELLRGELKERQALDLESFAQHRGSVFGGLHSGQPAQSSFENDIASQFLRFSRKTPVLIEDESRRIGDLLIPDDLFRRMRAMPRVEIICSLEERVARITSEYLAGLSAADELHIDEQEVYFLTCLKRIEKPLGGQRFRELLELLLLAFVRFRESLRIEEHESWIQYLLQNYYDPFYDMQLANPERKTIFRGNSREVTEFLLHKSSFD